MAQAPEDEREQEEPTPPPDEVRTDASGTVRWQGLAWAAAAMVAGVAVAYWPVLSYGFVYDDYLFCYAVPWREVARCLAGPWDLHGVEHTFYRPLVILSYALDGRLYGASAVGYHATNLLLHAAACWALFYACRRLGLGTRAAAAAAGLMLVSPLSAVGATWISSRTDSICAIFYLLSLAQVARPARALGFMALAIGSKEMAVTLPATLLLADLLLVQPHKGARIAPGRVAARHAPFWGLAAAYLACQWLGLGTLQEVGVRSALLDPGHALLDWSRLIVSSVFPVAPFHGPLFWRGSAFPLLRPVPVHSLVAFAGGAALTVASAVAARLARADVRALVFGLVGAAVACTPVIFRYDVRLLYLPGGIAAVAWGALAARGAARKGIGRMLAALGGLLMLSSCLITAMAYRGTLRSNSPHMISLDLHVCRRWHPFLPLVQRDLLRRKLADIARAVEQQIAGMEQKLAQDPSDAKTRVELADALRWRGLAALDPDEQAAWYARASAQLAKVPESPQSPAVRQAAIQARRDLEREVAELRPAAKP